MSRKTISYSVRVSGDDSDFLSALEIPGASTPSEKIRALINEARLNRAGSMNYADDLLYQEGQLFQLKRTILEMERDSKLHSELVRQFLNWLPEITAFLRSEVGSEDDQEPEKKLVSLEEGLADRVMNLFEMCLRLAVTPQEPCYETGCIKKRAQPVLELSRLINLSISLTRKESNDE